MDVPQTTVMEWICKEATMAWRNRERP